ALRDASPYHVGGRRRRVDGVHAVDRRFRHHVLHRGRGNGDAAAADLFDDQDRCDTRGQCLFNAPHPASLAADRRRLPPVAQPATLRLGDSMNRLLALAVAAAVVLFAAPAGAATAKIHLYNWNNYIAPETVKRFEELCKCALVQTYYSDNEEVLAKLAAGAKGYDVLVPTANVVQPLIKGG